VIGEPPLSGCGQLRFAVVLPEARLAVNVGALLCRLSRIKRREHAHPAALACDGAFGREIIRSAVNASRAYAPVIVTDHNTPVLVDRGIVEVEQVAAGAALADTAR